MAAKMVRIIRMFGLKLSFLKYIHFSKEPIGLVSVHTFFFNKRFLCMTLVLAGCPAIWKTWKCQGILLQGEKVKEKSGNFKKKTGKFREFCCVKSIFSQYEHPNFENFLGEHATRAP